MPEDKGYSSDAAQAIDASKSIVNSTNFAILAVLIAMLVGFVILGADIYYKDQHNLEVLKRIEALEKQTDAFQKQTEGQNVELAKQTLYLEEILKFVEKSTR